LSGGKKDSLFVKQAEVKGMLTFQLEKDSPGRYLTEKCWVSLSSRILKTISKGMPDEILDGRIYINPGSKLN